MFGKHKININYIYKNMKNLVDLEKKINSELGTKITNTQIKHNQIYVEINKDDLIDVTLFIKTNKNTPYYHKWNWLDKNFFEIKIEKLNHLSELFYFINAAKNFPNNYNGPFLNYENKKFIIPL